MRCAIVRAALCLTSLMFFARCLVAADPPKPNILLLFADDLTCQSVSCYGEKRHLLKTPNFDRIAAEGIRFDRCLVTNSICGPSRASILTGKYSHRNGFYNNTNGRFDGSQATFPKMLQSAGYATAVIGKWHLVSDPTGFDEWQILPGQGFYYNPPMIHNGQAVKHVGYTTDIVTDLSIEWLKNRDRTKPFLLMTQHKAPHREWSPALRDLGWDNDRQYPEPETLFDDFAGRSKAVSDHDMGLDRTFTDADAKFVDPPNMTQEQLQKWNAYYGPRNEAFRRANLQGKDLIRWRYNRYMHDYLGCVKAVDENVGRMLQFLEQEGLAENTIVIFSSDQGFFLGEHGWFDKRWIFEESLHSIDGPLAGRYQTQQRQWKYRFANRFCRNIPRSCRTSSSRGHAGAKPMPILRGTIPSDWRKSLYYHYYEFPVPHRVRPHYGVITDRYKLVHYYKPDVDDWELLDRQRDPLETKSFYNDPAYAQVIKDLCAELDRLRVELHETGEPPLRRTVISHFDLPRNPNSSETNSEVSDQLIIEKPSDAENRRGPALLAATGILSARVVRLLAMNGDLALDEIWSLWFVKQSIRSFHEIFFLKHDNNHLLNTMVMYGFGPELPGIIYRIPPAILSILSVWIAGRIAQRRGGLPARNLTWILVGLSYILILYSTEAKGYSYLIFFAYLSWWFLLRTEASGRVTDAAVLP